MSIYTTVVYTVDVGIGHDQNACGIHLYSRVIQNTYIRKTFACLFLKLLPRAVLLVIVKFDNVVRKKI